MQPLKVYKTIYMISVMEQTNIMLHILKYSVTVGFWLQTDWLKKCVLHTHFVHFDGPVM